MPTNKIGPYSLEQPTKMMTEKRRFTSPKSNITLLQYQYSKEGTTVSTTKDVKIPKENLSPGWPIKTEFIVSSSETPHEKSGKKVHKQKKRVRSADDVIYKMKDEVKHGWKWKKNYKENNNEKGNHTYRTLSLMKSKKLKLFETFLQEIKRKQENYK